MLDRSTAYPLFGFRAGRLAARLVESGEIDLVHGLGASVLGYATARASIRARAPMVLNPQGLEEFGGTGQRFAGGRLKQAGYAPLRWAVRACAERAAAVIATDRSIEPAVLRYLKIPRNRMATIPNAVDLDACDALARPSDGHHMRRFVPAGSDYILLSVGRIEQNKGFHVLAEALGKLRGRSWFWVLVGDGPFRPALERQIAALELGAKVRLVGRTSQEDLHAWYEAADLFVHPTLYEGSSLVTLEAMAHRRAVVATTAGGLPDKVHQGVTGLARRTGRRRGTRRGAERRDVASRALGGPRGRRPLAGRTRVLLGRGGRADDCALSEAGADPRSAAGGLTSG